MKTHAMSSWGTMFAHDRAAPEAISSDAAPVAAALPAVHAAVEISDEEREQRAALAAARGEDASHASAPEPQQPY